MRPNAPWEPLQRVGGIIRTLAVSAEPRERSLQTVSPFKLPSRMMHLALWFHSQTNLDEFGTWGTIQVVPGTYGREYSGCHGDLMLPRRCFSSPSGRRPAPRPYCFLVLPQMDWKSFIIDKNLLETLICFKRDVKIHLFYRNCSFCHCKASLLK